MFPASGFIAALALACLAGACDGEVADTERKSEPASGGETVESQNIDDEQFREASGIAFHPARGTLFVITDEGDVGELRTDGTFVQRRHLLYEDFEGITCNPATGLLYIVIEGRDNILEVDPAGLVVRREFDIDRDYRGARLFEEGGNGLEGIAFVPDPRHPEGGTFYVVNRSPRASDRDDPPLLLEVELPLRRDSTTKLEGSIRSYARLDIEGLSGLCYDTATQILHAVSDGREQMIRMTRQGEVLETRALDAESPEGVTFDDEGNLYIARDPGGIVRIRPGRTP